MLYHGSNNQDPQVTSLVPVPLYLLYVNKTVFPNEGEMNTVVKYLQNDKRWLDESGVSASPYDLISHEHVPR